MKIGFIGLGKMGGPMVQRLLSGGHDVIVIDHHQENIDAATAKGAVVATNHSDMVSKLDSPIVIWLMIPAARVDDELTSLLELLPAGSIIIDGGNSDFRLTRTRAARCLGKNVTLMDVGTSGGIMGLENGYCMMVGGDQATYATIEPLVQTLAQPDGYGYFGPAGAGHYVKMVHNAIEYGVMEAYAEGYMVLKEGKDYPDLDLGKAGQVWQHGSIISSKLNELATGILTTNANLDGIDGYVAESGEARWTLEIAEEQAIPMPVVQASFDRRIASTKGETSFATKLLAALRNGFGGHEINKK
ncbi:MAG TPA: decarboxylating 6-phosphogluconate dehydrogenase [Candidatus Saccharimonadales bacterium]|nr:decarboxylating 6-phosphogluconate dehydrogenase [Candidatus Saccharimonadales bacterium]